jgi:CheY-like chemotaxis protein
MVEYNEYHFAKQLQAVKLLVVEDHELFRRTLDTALKRLGFRQVTIVADGNQALALCQQQAFDIVLTDYIMAGMDGVGFTQALRKSFDAPSQMAPVIMMTACTVESEIRDARDAGITEFIAKPFTIEQLCQRIIAVVERPRQFVLAPGFKGHDRRRRHEEPPVMERRRRGKAQHKEPL